MNKETQERNNMLVFNRGKLVLIEQAISCILNSPLADYDKIYKQLQKADKIINEVNVVLENRIKKLEK